MTTQAQAPSRPAKPHKKTPPVEEMAKDIRIDRFISWALMTVVSVGIMIASLTYRSLTTSLDKLNTNVVRLSENVAVLQNQIVEVAELKARIRSLELQFAETRGHTPRKDP